MEAYIRRFDAQNGQDLLRYLEQPGIRTLVVSPVLCVGARLGGEVRSFQVLAHVSLAIGVDLNPGTKNPLVLYGNAHSLWQFKDGAFGSVFSNVLNHVLHIDQFATEAHRVLASGGTLLIHLHLNSMEVDQWAVNDMTAMQVQQKNAQADRGGGLHAGCV